MLTANATREGEVVPHPHKGILVELGDMQGVGDLSQHVTHGCAQPCPGYHDQHFVLRATLIPDLHTEGKEKSTPLGVMMGASVPRSNPKHLHTPRCHTVQQFAAIKGLATCCRVLLSLL